VVKLRHALAVGVFNGHVILAALEEGLSISLLKNAAIAADAPLQLLPPC